MSQPECPKTQTTTDQVMVLNELQIDQVFLKHPIVIIIIIIIIRPTRQAAIHWNCPTQ